MRKIILLLSFTASVTICKAQRRLSFYQLEQALNSSLNKTEENLFLVGYSFVNKDSIPGNDSVAYTYSTRGKTIATAKAVTKGLNSRKPEKSYIQYITYEPAEFQKLRRYMVENGFTRSKTDSISENSNYFKDNLEVQFKTDGSNTNKAYIITLRNRPVPAAKTADKILKN